MSIKAWRRRAVYYFCIVFMTVGVVRSRRPVYHDDDAEGSGLKPIELEEARRICASLCIAGLGGKPCGETCASIQPAEFSSQSLNEDLTNKYNKSQSHRLPPTGSSRRDACPILCQYHLGEPLCQCPEYFLDVDSYKVDFNRICAFFCFHHQYQMHGCRSCQVYQRQDLQENSDLLMRRLRPTPMEIDWDAWCREKCSQGDGGAACNCDILPMMSRDGLNRTAPAQNHVMP